MNWLTWITLARKVITYFRDNHELIKSIVLTALITLSLVLTWSLWTFKPSYSVLEGARIVKKQEVDKADLAILSQVVTPSQIVYHKGDELYGIEANKMMDDLHKKINEAKFFIETRERPKEFNPNDFPTKEMKNNEYIEVVYPFGMPQEIYKEVFSFDTEITASKPQNVDRIFLYQNSSGSVEGYLVSYQYKKMQKLNVPTLGYAGLLQDIHEKMGKDGFVPYISHDIKERSDEGENKLTRRFYFPKNPIELSRYGYISKATTEDTYEKYKKALFKDPLSVKSAKTNVNEVTFTDGTSAMVINELRSRFTYTNFAGLYRNTLTGDSPLFQSIEYINSHAGWGNPYIVSNLNNNRAEFWLYVQNTPVLDPDMQMRLEWAENELQEYERSMIQLDLSETSYPSTLSEKVTIQSGEEVKRELVESDYNVNYINDVRIGFTMKRQGDPHSYMLEPKWFINYETKGWIPLFKKDREEGY